VKFELIAAWPQCGADQSFYIACPLGTDFLRQLHSLGMKCELAMMRPALPLYATT
jgi:hypothetical protein